MNDIVWVLIAYLLSFMILVVLVVFVLKDHIITKKELAKFDKVDEN